MAKFRKLFRRKSDSDDITTRELLLHPDKLRLPSHLMASYRASEAPALKAFNPTDKSLKLSNPVASRDERRARPRTGGEARLHIVEEEAYQGAFYIRLRCSELGH